MTGPEGNPRIAIQCSPRDQSLGDVLCSTANGSNRWQTNNDVIDKCRATVVNDFTGISELFPVRRHSLFRDVARSSCIWRETVSFLDVV